MQDFAEHLTKFKYVMSALGEASVVPPTGDGYVFLQHTDTNELYAFDCSFAEVLKHAVQSGGDEFWPDKDPFEAQLALFSVHVMEVIDLAPDGARILTFGKNGLEAVKGKLPTAASPNAL